MILVTGGTGFIGRVLVRHLVDSGYQVRILIRPSTQSPRLPQAVNVEVSVAGLNDPRSLRAAMVGVDTVYHLAGVERLGTSADLLEVDVRGTQNVVVAAADAKVNRIYFLSHLGSDRASAFPLLKAKAISEEYIRRAGINFTILRTGLIFGDDDGFTSGLAQLMSGLPLFFFIPGDGNNLIQPLWVEDLAACLTWSLEYERTLNQVYEVGGPEFLTLSSAVKIIMRKLNLNRTIINMSPPLLKILTVMVEYLLPTSPVSVYWLDYFSTNRTCSLDTIPRVFNLMPSRFSQRLDYLESKDWQREMLRRTFKRRD